MVVALSCDEVVPTASRDVSSEGLAGDPLLCSACRDRRLSGRLCVHDVVPRIMMFRGAFCVLACVPTTARRITVRQTAASATSSGREAGVRMVGLNPFRPRAGACL